MNILVPVMQFGKAGGYRTLSRLATEWVRMGNNVCFVTFMNSEKPYFPTKARIIYVDKKGYECQRNSDYSANLLVKLKAIVKYLKRHSIEYDIVLANHNITAWAVKIGSKSNNFYYIQAYEPELYEKRSLKNLIMNLVARSTYHLGLIQIVNAEIYMNYKDLHSNYVVPPGMDLSVYYPKEVQWDGKCPLTIGCIGRTEEWKGSGDVAKAIKIVREKGENVNFKVAFNPVDCEDYELVKPDGDENLSAYYRSLDVLVAPAKLQLGAIHYPVLEAMASGTTLITTGYYPANDSNAYIVPVSSPDKIADAIIEIIHDRDTALKKTKVAVGEIQRFDWCVVSKDMLNIFEKTTNGGYKDDNA